MPTTTELAQTCISNLKEAAAFFSKSLKATKAKDEVDQPTKEERKILAEGLKLEASKIGLMWGNGAPSPAEAESLLASFELRHSQLLTLMCRLGNGAGPSLLAFLKETAAPVTESCINLVAFLSSHESIPEGQAAIKTGQVSAACEAASKRRFDSQTALVRQYLFITKRVKDNAREVKELVAQGVDPDAEKPAKESDDATESLSDSEDLDFTERGLSAPEHKLAKFAQNLIDVLLDSLDFQLRMLMYEEVMSEDKVSSWESLLFHAQRLADSSNDLGAALYPPQLSEDIIDICDSIEVSTGLIAEETPEGESDDTLQLQSKEFALHFHDQVVEAQARIVRCLEQ